MRYKIKLLLTELGKEKSCKMHYKFMILSNLVLFETSSRRCKLLINALVVSHLDYYKALYMVHLNMTKSNPFEILLLTNSPEHNTRMTVKPFSEI